MDLVNIGICCALCFSQIIFAYLFFKNLCRKSECCDQHNIYTTNRISAGEKNENIKINNAPVINHNKGVSGHSHIRIQEASVDEGSFRSSMD